MDVICNLKTLFIRCKAPNQTVTSLPDSIISCKTISQHTQGISSQGIDRNLPIPKKTSLLSNTLLGFKSVTHVPSEIYAKLTRAESKFIALKQSINEWCDKNELALACELRPERHGLNLICDMEGISAPIESWRLDFGEIIYSLRSTLDNLIFYCARRHSDPPKKPRSLYFPIFTDPHQYSAKAKATTSQLEDEISELLEKIQPYHRDNPDVEGTTDTDPLVSLNFLSNFDKHRMPTPFLVPPNEISLNQACQFYSESDAEANIPPNVVVHVDPLEHEKIVMEYITNCPIKDASGNFHIKAGVAVEVNGNRRELFEILGQLIWYARLIVDEFEKTLTTKSTRTPTA